MAAADLSRSRAAASRSTKGLFFISTLLCLLCFASSLVDKDQLEKHKENYRRSKQELDRLKEKHEVAVAWTSKIMSEHMISLDKMTALLKEANKFLPGSFPSMETHMENITAVMKKTKDRLDRDNEELYRQMQNIENDLAKLQKIIQFLEELQAEL